MESLKTAFHVHTDHSDDCNASVADILAEARRRGIGCVAITDHDTIEGALGLRRAAGDHLKVIIGEEISTRDGHLIGIFLKHEIEPGLSARRTAELIREQGGLVIAPHPFNSIFGCSLREKVRELVGLLDAVEVCNSQNLLPFPNRRAAAFAAEHCLPAIVGVDMHQRGHLDSCYQWLEPFDGPAGFLQSLRSAHFVAGRHPLAYFARAAYGIVRERCGLGMPRGYGRNAHSERRHGRRVIPGHAASTRLPDPSL